MELDPIKAEARQLWILMSQVHSGLYRARDTELRPMGIPIMHTTVLWALKVLGRPATPAEISRMIDRRHQSVLQLLERMEKQGLVNVERSDRRGGPVKLTLTPKGEEAAEQAAATEEVIAGIFSCLSEDEREVLRGYLKRLREKAFVIASTPRFPG